jgi:hypothetical protein
VRPSRFSDHSSGLLIGATDDGCCLPLRRHLDRGHDGSPLIDLALDVSVLSVRPARAR